MQGAQQACRLIFRLAESLISLLEVLQQLFLQHKTLSKYLSGNCTVDSLILLEI